MTLMFNLASPHRKLSLSIRVMIAIGLYIVATVLHILTISIDHGLAYVTYFPAVTLSFYICGLRPAIVTTVLSALTGLIFFTPPLQTIPTHIDEYNGLIYFLLGSYFIGFAIKKLQDSEQIIAKHLEYTHIELDHSKNILKMAKLAAKAGTWHWNLQTNKMVWDDEMFMLFGVTQSEPTLQIWENTLHPDDIDQMKFAIEDSLRKGKPFICSYRIILPGNKIRWIDAYGSVYSDDAGNPIEMMGINIDSTKIRESDFLIRENESRLRYFFEHLPMPHVVIDATGHCLEVNQKAVDMLGFENAGQVIGLCFKDFYVADARGRNVEIYAEFERTHQMDGELELVSSKGKKVSVIVTSHVEKDANAHYLRTHLIMTNITERRIWEDTIEKLNAELEAKVLERTSQLEKTNAALLKVAREDALTELPNRLALNERLHTEFLRLRRKKSPYALLMLDIDFFKRVNDSNGHVVGDDVLVNVAKILKGVIREMDFVCRYGGEEFLVLLPDTDLNGACQVAEKIRKVVADTEHPVAGHLTVSIGAAVADANDSDEDVAVKKADDALYIAKNSGRNQVVPANEKANQNLLQIL